MSSPLFSTGTARGGTTFFARILSVNNEVKVTSDPYLPLFRSLRTEIIRKFANTEFDENLPLDDYYFSDEKLNYLKTIQQKNLDMPFPQESMLKLHAQLKARAPMGAKELLPYLDQLEGTTYTTLFRNAIRLLEKAHCVNDIKWCGFNDNWVVEFFPLIAKSFSDAKFFVILRDPRAAIASALKLREKEPELVPLIYSFAHSWRKHAAFATVLQSDPSINNRLMVFRYEDLVKFPRQTVRKFCEFLEVEFSEAMLDTEQFRPYQGEKWKNWSHFNVPSQGIFTEAIDRWKDYLSKGMIEYIEFVCDPEMRLFGYDPFHYSGRMPSENVMREMQRDDRESKGWRGNHSSWDLEHSFELFRKQALLLNKNLLTTHLIEKYFLFEDLYDQIKKTITYS